MKRTHRVQPGDWLGSIAARYGFEHGSALWEHPVNAQLRELRSSPDLLMVGDEVTLPGDDDPAGIEVASGQRVRFKIRPDDVLRLRLGGVVPFIAVFGPVPYSLTIGDRTFEGELGPDSEGALEVPLRPGDDKATLTLMHSTTYELSIGGLGPVEESKGAHARLINLGFGDPGTGDADEAGDATPSGDQAGDPLSLALRAFQRREGLEVDGVLQPPTAEALKERYGG
ncbi:MAG: peptidoglycan-binding protein [Myxococcota bacterium]